MFASVYWTIGKYAAIAAAVASACAWSYSRGDARATERAALAAARLAAAQVAQIDAANVRADRAAASFEEWKRNHKPKTITVTREIVREIEKHKDWANEPIPDSVRDALSELARHTNPAESDGTVLGPDVTPATD
ncbi:MAG: hypothetical protein H0V63_10330 [Burkholderiaceae bacterium]|nr:hypothetical protein [Burkholderiaceae bacterium]